MTPEEQIGVAVQVGEIAAKIDERDRKLDAIHASLKEDLSKIEKQTTVTNGRVTTHERKFARIEGAIAVVVFLLSIPLIYLVLDGLVGK